MFVRSLELQEVSNNLFQRISNYIFTSHHVKTSHINNHVTIKGQLYLYDKKQRLSIIF